MTFFTYDDDDCNADTREVLKASAELEITEFHLFELAHLRWFGELGTEPKIERLFTPYMYGGPVPFWVRQYCRDVLARVDEGRLEPRDFGVDPRPEDDSMVRRGLRYTALVVSVLTTLHLIAILVGGYTGYGGGSRAAAGPVLPAQVETVVPKVR